MAFFKISFMFYTQKLLLKIVKNQMAEKGSFTYFFFEAEKQVSQFG